MSIIVPAHNEEARIEKTVSLLTKEFSDSEIILIVSGNDKTVEKAKKFPVKIYRFYQNLGKGGSIKEGIARASGDKILFIDADLPVPVGDIRQVIEECKKFDLVTARRRRYNPPLMRKILHFFYKDIVYLLFWSTQGLADLQAGLKCMDKAGLERVKDMLMVNDFTFDVNLVYAFRKAGLSVKEVQVQWDHEEKGSKVSSATLKVSLHMFLSLAKMRVYFSPMRGLLDLGPVKSLERRLVRYFYEETRTSTPVPVEIIRGPLPDLDKA